MGFILQISDCITVWNCMVMDKMMTVIVFSSIEICHWFWWHCFHMHIVLVLVLWKTHFKREDIFFVLTIFLNPLHSCLLDIHLWLNVIGWWFQSVYKLNFKTDQADVGWFALAPIGGGSLYSSVWCFSESWISVTLWCRKTLQHSLISSWLTSLGLKYFQTTEQALYLLSAADIYFLLVALPALCMSVFLHEKSVCYIWNYFVKVQSQSFLITNSFNVMATCVQV